MERAVSTKKFQLPEFLTDAGDRNDVQWALNFLQNIIVPIDTGPANGKAPFAYYVRPLESTTDKGTPSPLTRTASHPCQDSTKSLSRIARNAPFRCGCSSRTFAHIFARPCTAGDTTP